MTRVVVLPSDETACGTYRMRWPASSVQKIRPDWEVEIYRPSDVRLGTGAKGSLWLLQGIPDLGSIDLLVMQRVATRAQAELVRWAQHHGIAVVVDADDALWCIDSANAAHTFWDGPAKAHRWLDDATEHADLVTVTTPALARRYGPHGRVEVLANVVPPEALTVDRAQARRLHGLPADVVTVGWSGFTATHPGDLAVARDALHHVTRNHRIQLVVVGDARGAARDWSMAASQVHAIAPHPLGMDYYTALAVIDVALVPLRDSPFNRAKSSLKAVEFSAVGASVIASDTPANRAAGKSIGFPCAGSPRDWNRLLSMHTGESGQAAREHYSARAQAAVARDWTFEVTAGRWAGAWERALTRRKNLSKSA